MTKTTTATTIKNYYKNCGASKQTAKSLAKYAMHIIDATDPSPKAEWVIIKHIYSAYLEGICSANFEEF